MHEKMHVKLKINEKERVIWTYQLMERETLQEIRRKMTKICCGALPSRREREKEKSLKSFEKGELNKSRSYFKKAYS